MQLKLAEILLIEDNLGDTVLLKACMARSPIKCHIQVAEDGVKALAMLRREGEYQTAARPDIILLDMNLPMKDGAEVLIEIKAHPTLKRIPVIVFTSSDMQEDIVQAYDLNANCYIQKPSDFQEGCLVANAILNFWFSIAKLPDNTLLP